MEQDPHCALVIWGRGGCELGAWQARRGYVLAKMQRACPPRKAHPLQMLMVETEGPGSGYSGSIEGRG
jgi:hypothetical protein